MRKALVLILGVFAGACGGRVTEVGDASPGPSPTQTAPEAGQPVPLPLPIADGGPTPVVDTGSPIPTPTIDATSPPPPPAVDSGTTIQSDACVIPAGGKSCNPSEVSCGTSMCTIPAEMCCLEESGQEECVAAGASCTGLPQTCDEASDCPGGEVCCLEATSPSVAGVSVKCETSCTGGLFSIQICRSDTECPGGQCIPQTCSLGGGSLSVEACGLIPEFCTMM
jgi:hypothetical protein